MSRCRRRLVDSEKRLDDDRTTIYRMKRKLTAAEKRERRRRKKTTMIIFLNGKQKRVPRPPMVEGFSEEEFLRRNADPIWLDQNQLWWEMPD